MAINFRGLSNEPMILPANGFQGGFWVVDRKSQNSNGGSASGGNAWRKRDLNQIIQKIKNLPNRPPILLIWGKQDKLIPVFLAKKLVKLHPWLKLIEIDDAGHCLHDELPTVFNQIVLKWLKNLKTSNQPI